MDWGAGHNVVVLHTLDPYEIGFPFKGAWCFEGLEEEEPLTTQADRIREDYLASFGTYMETLRDGCVASHVERLYSAGDRRLESSGRHGAESRFRDAAQGHGCSLSGHSA